ncbi:hypothetical protein ABC337_13815 [Arthrobacter sp. 1P04PC]|uniref:hypothetical protein n=1 Tax=unclassified Arthrobacter TaxID=235627 RepID=UPI0039A2F50C
MDIVGSLNLADTSLHFVIVTEADNHRYFKSDEAARNPEYRRYHLELVRVVSVPANMRIRLHGRFTPNKKHDGGWVWVVLDSWRELAVRFDKGEIPDEFVELLGKWNVAGGWYGNELMARMNAELERKELLKAARESGAAAVLLDGTL